MAVPYPSNPTDGMLFTYRGQTYSYSEAEGWEDYQSPPSSILDVDIDSSTVSIVGNLTLNGSTVNPITVSTSLPTGGSDGDIWMVYS